MIKKLDIKDYENKEQLVWFGVINKINELCDIINTIQKEREAEWFEIKEWIDILEAVRKSVNIHEKQIDELQMKVEPEKCETRPENVQPDAESRPENVQKEPITLLDIFNEMGEMYSSLWNKMEDIHHDLKTKSGDNE